MKGVVRFGVGIVFAVFLVLVIYFAPGMFASPLYSQNSTNGTGAGMFIEHRLKWTNDSGLAGYIFSFCNGTWNGSDCGIIQYYQENATQIECAGMWDPVRICSNVFDDDWNTVGTAGPGTWSAVYFNYTKPSGALSSSMWRVKDSPTVELAIPADCWSLSPLQLRVYLTEAATISTLWACYNTSGNWKILRNYTVVTSPDAYEEAMVWNISWGNNSWVPMTGTANWSNVSKWVNTTVGANIAWKVYANDTGGGWNTSKNYTYVTIQELPVVTLISPANNNFTNQHNITFNCSAIDLVGFGNITLWHNVTGTWVKNQTKSITGKSGYTEFYPGGLPDGSVGWSCMAMDNDSQVDFPDANWTVNVDTSPPNVTITTPNNDTYVQEDNYTLYLRVAANETINTWWYSNNSGVNTTFTPNTTINFINGSNSIQAWANDSAGNVETSLVRWLTLDTTDYTKPNITISAPMNKTYVQYNNYTLSLNVSANETINAWWYSLNSGSNTTFTPNISITALNGSNSIRVWGNDSVGHIGASLVRYFTLDTSDYSHPRITIYVPENKTYKQGTHTIDLDVSANMTMDKWWYSLNNGANTTFPPNTTITAVNGTNNITVWANTTNGILNHSYMRYFTLDYYSNYAITIVSPYNRTYYTYSMTLNGTINQPTTTALWFNINNGTNRSITCANCLTYTIDIRNRVFDGFNILYVWGYNGSIWNSSGINFTTVAVCNSTYTDTTRCGGDAERYVLNCRQYGKETYQWDMENLTWCEEGCVAGQCRHIMPKCQDRCSEKDLLCFDDKLYSCANVTEGGCLDWDEGNITRCLYGCYEAGCLNETTYCNYGDSKCLGNKIVWCDDDNNDSFYEWSSFNITPCEFGCVANYTTGILQCSSSPDTGLWNAFGMAQYFGRATDFIFNTLRLKFILSIIAIIGVIMVFGKANWQFGIISGIMVMFIIGIWIPEFFIIALLITMIGGGIMLYMKRGGEGNEEEYLS